MSNLSNPPVSVYSHPYHPELSLLRVWLMDAGYHTLGVEHIVSHAAAEGTLEGLVEQTWLDAADEAEAEEVFVGGMEPVPQVSAEWDDLGTWVDDSDFPRKCDLADRQRAMDELIGWFELNQEG